MAQNDEMREIIDGFLIEAKEIFDDLSNSLVEFEKNPNDAELINSIFRGFHTLKGTAGFLDFGRIEKVAHGLEDLLNQVRQGKRSISSADIDIVFEGMDILQELMEKIEADGNDEMDVEQFVNKMRSYLSGEGETKKSDSKPVTKNTGKKSKPKETPETRRIKVEIPPDSMELLEPFLGDTMDSLSRALEILGSDKEKEEKLTAIRQIVDTIKGSAGFVDFDQIEKLALAFVKYLDRFKEEGADDFTTFHDEFLRFNDILNSLVNDYKKDGMISTDYAQYVEQLGGVVVPSSSEPVGEQKKPPLEQISQPSKVANAVDDGLEQNKVYEITDEIADLVEVFFTELEEILTELNGSFVELEQHPDNGELINSIFRGIHTIKGTSGFIGFDHMVKLTHVMEDVLNRARNFEVKITPVLMDVLLEGIDYIVELKEKFKAHEPIALAVGEYKLKLLNAVEKGDSGASSTETDAEVSPKQSVTKKTEAAPTKDITKSYLGKFSEKTIRVDVERLDNLMDLVGELVLGRNRLVQIISNMQLAQTDHSHELTELVDSTGNVDFLTTEIQSAVMKTRMVPIGRVFSKFPRLVRDLAREAGKKIELKMFGEETEVDKSVSEDIGDPLVHILRNSVDHGLEPPEERTAQGKTETGTINLNAYHEGNSIVIECVDDGRGIDPEKIKAKAIEKGLITPEEAAKMPKAEALDLIFKPGFSTAKKITNISGRGVGMDVVKTNVAKLNGIISIDSEVGKGTTMKLQLPLTLAIIQGLVIRVYEEIYIVPLGSVLETYRIKKEDMYTVKGNYVIRLRDEVLPIIQLEDILDIPNNGEDWESRYVVVIGLANMRAGIVVDELIGQKEIVIKSLGSFLGSIPGIGGCSILGDGRIRLILDVGELINLTKEVRRKIDSK